MHRFLPTKNSKGLTAGFFSAVVIRTAVLSNLITLIQITKIHGIRTIFHDNSGLLVKRMHKRLFAHIKAVNYYLNTYSGH